MFSHHTTHVDIRTVKTDGQALSLELLTDMVDLRIEQSIHLPDVAKMRFNDPEFEHMDSGDLAISSELSIALTDDEANEHDVFSGEITGLSIEPGGGEAHELVITALGKGHRLARKVQVRTFTEMTDSDIVSKIANENSLTPDVDTTPTTHSYVLQSSSDFEFLSQRARLLGYRWWISGSKLFFKDVAVPSTSTALTWGENLLSFRVRLSSSDSVSDVAVRGWDPDSQSAIIGSWTASANRTNGLAGDAPAATDVAAKAADFGPSARFESHTLADSVAADALAKSLGRRAMSSQVTVKGTADGDPSLAPGAGVTLAKVGKQLSGDFTVTKTEHIVGGDGGYTTRFVCEGINPSDLVALLGSPPPPSAATGLMVGTVTAINDEDQAARIKVKLPTLSDSDESAWARLAAPGAGSGYGLQLLPEIDDEVIVGFEQGDPLRPVILGGLWSTTKAPPLDNATSVVNDQVAVRALYTRKGHRIEVKDDENGTTNTIMIALADEKGTIEITEDGGVSIKTPQDIAITAEGDISLKATGDLSLEGANVNIEASSNVKITGNEVSADGTSKVGIKGASVEAKASGTLSLEGSATAELKGGMVQIN